MYSTYQHIKYARICANRNSKMVRGVASWLRMKIFFRFSKNHISARILPPYVLLPSSAGGSPQVSVLRQIKILIGEKATIRTCNRWRQKLPINGISAALPGLFFASHVAPHAIKAILELQPAALRLSELRTFYLSPTHAYAVRGLDDCGLEEMCTAPHMPCCTTLCLEEGVQPTLHHSGH